MLTASTHSMRTTKGVDTTTLPFAATFSLVDNFIEINLYIFFPGSQVTTPQAINISVLYPHVQLDLLDKLRQDALLPVHLYGPAFVPEVASNASANDIQDAAPSAKQETRVYMTHVSTEADTDDYEVSKKLLETANEGMAQRAPELVQEGEGGTYFVFGGADQVVGVFKPADQDPQAENNPKKKLAEEKRQQPTRKSIPANGTAIREAAAYALDRGFAGVPPTLLVEANHPVFNNGEEGAKPGSFQQFVPNECSSWDVGPAAFSVEDVHRIGLFDIRTFNTDRHGGNLLCAKAANPQGKVEYDLIPIDHAYCFPTSLGEANWEWLYWPQAKVPFTDDELAYIESIDVEADLALLRKMHLDEDALRVYRITTTFLKAGAAAGLTLYEMGKLCYRRRLDEPSQLEVHCSALEKQTEYEHEFFSKLAESAFDILARADGTRRNTL